MTLPKVKFDSGLSGLKIIQVKDLTIFLLLICFSFLFFYKLGQTSLISWDEAWYADVSRNILKTGNPLNLVWNGRAFQDHPPFGFWLIASSFKIFGVSEFWARFPSALFAFLTLFFVYLLGKNLFNRSVGFLSSFALVSSHWFLYRARSANLDIFLTCLFVAALYFFIKLSTNKKFLIPSILSLSFLFLTKTLIPFVILPVLIFIIVTSKHDARKNLIVALCVSLLLFISWFLYNNLIDPNFVSRFIFIGAPGVKLDTNYTENIRLVKTYVYEGIGKWFWPSVFAIGLSIFSFQKRFYILIIFIISFFIPFVFSLRGHIWHLIPLHPFMIITLVGFSYVFLKKILKKEILVLVLLFILVSYQAFIQTRRNWYEFVDINAFTSDEEILSVEAGKIDADFYIDSDFGPAAVFYSGKNVQQFSDPSIRGLFDKNIKFSLITFKWRIDAAKIKDSEYEIIKMDRDKILIVNK